LFGNAYLPKLVFDCVSQPAFMLHHALLHL
jgi:hypothetical protein